MPLTFAYSPLLQETATWVERPAGDDKAQGKSLAYSEIIYRGGFIHSFHKCLGIQWHWVMGWAMKAALMELRLTGETHQPAKDRWITTWLNKLRGWQMDTQTMTEVYVI